MAHPVAFALLGCAVALFAVWATNRNTPPTRGEAIGQFLLWLIFGNAAILLTIATAPAWGAWLLLRYLLKNIAMDRNLSAWFRAPLWEKP